MRSHSQGANGREAAGLTAAARLGREAPYSCLCKLNFEGGNMKYLKKGPSAALIILALLAVPACNAQAKTQESGKTSTAGVTDAKTTNTDAYIALLRRDVRQEKAEIMGAMMALSAQDSAKFWPIYSEYDEELTKLNDRGLRI